MKPLTFLLVSGCCLVSSLANDHIRDVQAALKNQGFYYGDITGSENTETDAAIRRFQIRNGISVTGKQNAETLAALGLGSKGGGASGKPPTPPPAGDSPAPKQLNPNVPPEKAAPAIVRNEPAPAAKQNPDGAQAPVPADDDAASARRLRSDGYAVVDPPTQIPAPISTPMTMTFRGTPYADAPREVQQNTVRRAQSIMAARRHYRGPIDGVAGPATSEAIFLYQAENELSRTGRLDLETLAEMSLLPSRPPGGPLLKPFYNPNRRRDSSVAWDFWIR